MHGGWNLKISKYTFHPEGSGHDSKIGNQSVAKVIIIERKWSFSPFIFLQLVKPQSGIEKKNRKIVSLLEEKFDLKKILVILA